MNKRFIFNLFGILTLATVVSCQGQTGVQVLSVDAFEQKLNATPEKIILDVRTDEEYAQGKMKNATQIDYYQRDFKTEVAKLDKTKPVFVYCASGVRSNSAAKILKQQGFTEVYDLKGGLNAWARSGKPVVK
ncbi:MAG: rhodanese-like domain-containing protein [Cyclobacteriaceae bacterium]|nr:MAG: rhodanese-like domain-containing protein [Cyclobacteriaceae bacterium]